MSEKKIFDNYQSRCPICGGELDSDYKICPYCGNVLIDENEEYKSNEEKIIEAFDDIDAAKQRLAETEDLLNLSKSNKRKSKVLMWILIIIFVPILFFICAGTIGSFLVIHEEGKVEEYIDELDKQKVDTIQIEEIDISDVEFTETSRRSSCGYMLESEEYLQIPFYSDYYDNEITVSGTITLAKEEIDEVYSLDADYCSISFENYSASIRVENTPYYDRAVDAVNIYDTDVIRLNNIKIDDYEFECYKSDYDRYTFVCDLGQGCFIEYSPYFYDDEVPMKDKFTIVNIDIKVE